MPSIRLVGASGLYSVQNTSLYIVYKELYFKINGISCISLVRVAYIMERNDVGNGGEAHEKLDLLNAAREQRMVWR